MRLVKIKIENFRSYVNIEVKLSDFSVIIGKNDVGKSTFLDALNIFFENEKPQENDSNVRSENKEITITCFFEVDEQKLINLDSSDSENTQTTLKDEYLLDENNLLQIKKIWGNGKLKNTFIVANYPLKDEWKVPLITLKINDLKKLIDEKAEVNKTIKKEIRQYLFKNNEFKFKLQDIDVSAKETDITNIYDKLKINLPKFILFRADRTNTDKDSEVVSITKAIAQNAVKEIEEKFAEIKQEVISKIQEFSNLTLEKLKSFNENIANSLKVNMQDKPLESLFSYEFQSDDEIPLNKRGSGIKRLFLLSFFLADTETKNYSNMIYAIEEPETSQHPNFQRMIMESLQALGQTDNRQILITTHTPEIVKMANKENIIFIKKDNNSEPIISQGENLKIKEIVNTLGILPYISNKGVMFVEGKTDINFFEKLNKFDCLKNIFDIKTITLIPLNGSGNILNWIKEGYLKGANIKELYFMDRDEEKNSIENEKIIRTKKREIENYFPIEILEEYFREKLKIDEVFSEKEKQDWDNQDISKIISNKQSKLGKEAEIKGMFYDRKIWDKINENNMQGFDEIKKWFEKMQEVFKE